MNNKKGFTLIELLVVVLIIGILAAMAMPAYFRSVERARISEAEILMGTVVQAQQRYKLRRGSGYTTNWKALDTAPAGVADGSALLDNAGTKYCTKGKTTTGTGQNATSSCGNGFQVELVGSSSAAGNNSGVIATRTGNDQYGQYQLARYYDPHTITGYGDVICAAGDNTNAQALCLDFMTVDTYPDSEPTLPSAE